MVAKLIRRQLGVEMKVLGLGFGSIALLCALLFLARGLMGEVAYIILSALLVLLASGMSFMTLLYIGIRYYGTMFGSEGYLTQTLPVNENTHMYIKFAIGFLQVILAYCVTLIACLLMFDAVGIAASAELSQIGPIFSSNTVGYLCMIALVQTAAQIIMVFLAITITNSRFINAGSPLMAIVVYIAIYFIMNILTVAAMVLSPAVVRIGSEGISFAFGNMITDMIADPTSATIGLGGILIELAFLICGFPLLGWLNKKQVIVR